MKELLFTSLQTEDIKAIFEEVLKEHVSELVSNKHESIDNLLLTRKETAKLLCISLPTLNEWTKTGILKAHRIGNRVLYKEKEVIEALVEVQTLKNGRGTSC
ncbi:helix-turn-helix domain-containing protein [Flagellimonas sp.]|uniref:helix-turn-helix domain-containing protein n=1 Tax=Flagellimonas sp. TaxID=2058762 RepID=UPI003BA84545